MYIKWKTLIGFGTLLWILLCVTDLFSENNQYRKGKFLASEDWYAEIDKEEFRRETSTRLNQLHIAESDLEDALKFSWNLIFWNFIAFTSTILCCGLLRHVVCKAVQTYLAERRKPELKEASTITLLEIVGPKISCSRIPIPVQTKLSEVCMKNFQLQEALSSAASLITLESKLSDNDRFEHHHMEKQCAKLREEMLMVQASSIKEHAVLSRKLDAVTREKRELSKQLAVAHKENRAAKQQLEELLVEKTMLLKRLENATKEFKVNTKSKKATLAKLEEAHDKIDLLKKQLEQVLREKHVLESRAKFMMVEECQSSGQPEKDVCNATEVEKNSECMGVASAACKEHVIDKADIIPYGDSNNNIPKNFEEDASISQATIDMKKIQMKIEMLEKNLEKFKQPRKQTQQDSDVSADTNKTDESSPSTPEQLLQYKEIFTRKSEKTDMNDKSFASICNRPNCPLEHEDCTRLECLFSEGAASRKRNSRSSSDEEATNKPTSQKMNYKTHTQKPHNNSNAFDDGGNDTQSTLSLAELETSSDEWPSFKKGLVSTSPAFQQFLRKLESEDQFPKIESAHMLLRF